MNSLERSLIEKLGYDNGWEVVTDQSPGSVILSSARHSASVNIMPDSQGAGFLLGFPDWIIDSELTRSSPCTAERGLILVKDKEALAPVLHRASQLAAALPSSPVVVYESTVAEILDEDPSQRGTEREAVVRLRVGQDVYRQALLEYWQGQCAVSGISVSTVLRASHAKPWADCQHDHERLNVYNGFLLNATLDALFDKGLITFSDSGEGNVSSLVPVDQYSLLGLNDFRLRWITEAHHPFLEWHRTQVFQK